MKTAASVARHGLPLAALYLSGAKAASYLLLTAFDLSLGLVAIVALKSGAKLDVARLARGSWIIDIPVMAVVFAIAAAVLTLPIGALLILYGVDVSLDWASILFSRSFSIAVGLMAFFAGAHGYFVQAHRARRAPPSTAADPRPVEDSTDGTARRLQADYAAQVTLIATFFLLCWDFGRPMFYAVPPLYAAVLVLYDMRPDFAEELLPTLWPKLTASPPEVDGVQQPQPLRRSKHRWRR
jgi:hypothetical protein